MFPVAVHQPVPEPKSHEVWYKSLDPWGSLYMSKSATVPIFNLAYFCSNGTPFCCDGSISLFIISIDLELKSSTLFESL